MSLPLFRWLPLLWLLACIPEGPREGLRAPAFEAQSVSGTKISSKDLTDRPTVLVFWASWCGPCLAEIPHINRLYAEIGEEAHIYGINASEDSQTAANAVHRLGIGYPVLLDPFGKINQLYQVEAIPMVIILDRDWRVRYRGNSLPLKTHALLDGLK